eukprot:CAMPEP_0170618822 /NCGR_PEP_ID=MMETSP0224-20130122/27169_1 /TAXON_ID=285029 /ORGANISM="Togula jolla, Strain CCCM 725" /LENGTH=238 /DNA_ID=CAMNT_0010944833 /DNA_START=491 /DNA_END=1203 /DNA_ORIENTATION=-
MPQLLLRVPPRLLLHECRRLRGQRPQAQRAVHQDVPRLQEGHALPLQLLRYRSVPQIHIVLEHAHKPVSTFLEEDRLARVPELAEGLQLLGHVHRAVHAARTEKLRALTLPGFALAQRAHLAAAHKHHLQGSAPVVRRHQRAQESARARIRRGITRRGFRRLLQSFSVVLREGLANFAHVAPSSASWQEGIRGYPHVVHIHRAGCHGVSSEAKPLVILHSQGYWLRPGGNQRCSLMYA